MAQQTLQTVIALSGRVDNSFGNIGNALINVGNHIDRLSRKIIEFGKESVEEYINYDDVMREVQALGEYNQSTMKELDAYNKSIAQSSKYTMEQAAGAEKLMAQLGLNVDQTKLLMPSVMNLATAANIELADSLDYLFYSINSLGMPMNEVNVLSDQMAKTAAISAADIDTLGQSFQRLGSTSKFFAGGSTELLAILGGIARFGEDMQGTNAGTQLRNFMLTLLAPTKSKATLMEQFGVTEGDWAEFESYMEEAEIDVTSTADAMNELGLSAYDSITGELKPAIQIIGEMNAALSGMTEAEKNAMLGQLFGKRTTTTAINLLESLDTIIELQKQIQNNSAGYTQAMSDTMEGGLGGTTRELNAAVNALEVTVGDKLENKIKPAAEWITNVVNGLANMDDAKLEGLIDGAAVLGTAGPALLLTGAAFRLIGYVLSPAGGIALGAVSLLALSEAIQGVNEANMAGQFGNMALDMEALGNHVRGISNEFSQGYQEIEEYAEAVKSAESAYTEASSTFSSNLLTAMLTGTTLTEEDKAALMQLGDDMHQAVMDGITNSTAGSMSYWEMLFGGQGVAANDPNYRNIIDLENESYKNAIAEAEGISQNFRAALTSAFNDGEVSQAEYEEILGWMRGYNEAMARASKEVQAEEDYIKRKMLLDKAQTASYADVQEMSKTIEEERANALALAEDNFKREYYGLEYKGAGEQELQAAKDAYEAHYQEQSAAYDELLLAMWESAIKGSDLSGAYQDVSDLADLYMAGGIAGETAHEIIRKQYKPNRYAAAENDMTLDGDNTSTQLDKFLIQTIHALGGTQGLAEKIAYYDSISDAEMADRLRKLYTMEQLVSNFSENGVNANGDVWVYGGQHGADIAGNRENYLAAMANYDNGIFTAEIARYIAENLADRGKDLKLEEAAKRVQNLTFSLWDKPKDKEAAAQLENIINNLKEAYDFDAILQTYYPHSTNHKGRDYLAAYEIMYGEHRDEIQPNVTMPSGAAAGKEFQTEAQQYLDNNPGSWTINTTTDFGGKGGQVWKPFKLYATGGRATEASIFGEAGPEWAIPEEHTDRTASLLDAARRGAGFTWPELMGKSGRSTPMQLIYSPTIVANDATGVADKLTEDKRRLEKWWKEKQIMEQVEVYS